MQRTRPEGYSATQIALHWSVVLLVIVRWLSHDAMEDFWDLIEDGDAAGGLPDDPGALIHLGSGAAVLVLMLVRAILRARHGAPPLPADMPALQKFAAHATHFALYAILIALPLTGAAAIFLGIEDASDIHSTLVRLLFLLIAAHLAGTVFHTFIRRDGLLWRMLVPHPSQTGKEPVPPPAR